MSGQLAGQIALITGASRGIGAATALALAGQGAHVILVARTADALEKVEEHIHQIGGTATIAPLDLTDAEAMGRLATAVQDRWSKLDILVLNAAMLGTLAPAQHLDAKEFAQILTLNLSAQQAMLAAFDPLLRQAGSAKIIGLTSSVGKRPRAFWGAYGASKAGFETLLGAYADENATSKRISVAIIDPGATATEMRAKAYPGEDPASLKEPHIVGNRIADLCVQGFASPHEEKIN
jgi:NAD(P)-dependent dehydrogenase (short-subunit alcohol dehydrogenase family)